MNRFAWVTLATNDSYSLGALVVANSLKKVNTSHEIAVLITPGVSESMKSKLEATFNVVIEVNVLDSKDAANLALLSRPELGVTFTKLHCWTLIQFEKCVFLDADTFVLQNCDELFDREELSAAPDVGWPDCFNSGVFVFRPSLDTFGKLIEFATKQGSFDGGDQGLLNSFFSDWSHKDISKHLPFIYNTCSTACYSYLPAFKQFGQNVKILHFIGQAKPWLLNFDSTSKTVHAPQGYGHLGDVLQQWWNVFCAEVHPALTKEMTTSAHQQYSDEEPWYQNPQCQYFPSIPIIPPQIEFIDPWDTYYESNEKQTDSDLYDHHINETHYVDHTVPNHNHQNESYHFPSNKINNVDCDDLQHNHKENANINSKNTITEPHISIQSRSNNNSDDIMSNSHFENYSQIVDTAVHSINTNSFLTFNHHHPYVNTPSESSTIGLDLCENGERDEDSCHSKNDTRDVVDVENDETTDTCEEGGLAGALAQLTLGSPRSPQQQAYEESMRRQCWEAGNIDYLGKDSFDNIWKRITKTIEIKSDTSSVPPPEKNRSPTPQPDEKLAVEEKKEVKIGSTFNESEEDILKSCTQIHERTVTEITTEGRVIEKKIVTYPGEETTEIEEIEEVDGQTVSVRRSIIGGENKDVKTKSKTLSEIKNEPVILVPGYRTVQFDEKTNSTIVTEKTTTGYQQTITVIQEDGTKKIQTKTFYDPVEIPGEEEEEETYEETESFEPGSKKTIVKKEAVENITKKNELAITEVGSNIEENSENKIEQQDATTTLIKNNDAVVDQTVTEVKEKKDSKILTDLKNQPVVIVSGHQTVEFNEETNTTTVTDKTTTGYQQIITTVTQDGRTIVETKVFYDPVPCESVEEVETIEETQVITKIGNIMNQEATTTVAMKDEVSEAVVEQEVKESKILTDLKNQPVVIVPGHQTVEFNEETNTTTVTDKTTTGYQQTITSVTQDGRTIVETKVFYDPVPCESVEEVETIEETQVITKIGNIVNQEATTTVAMKDEVSEAVVEQEVKESKILTDLKNQPVVIVPGHQTVEFNEETNTTTVTDKTTTGYQQTITTVTQDGRTIVQTKVFYDPVPCESVEEVETIEETHITKSMPKTTTTTITGTDNVDSVTSVKNTSEVQKTEFRQDTEERTETLKQKLETQTVTEAVLENQSDTTTNITDVKNLQLVLAGPTSLTQKKTTAEGKEIEVTTTVSEDGKTKTLKKTVRQPSEEIEIEEYEETHTYEPGEVKVVTTSKTIPLVEAVEVVAKEVVDNSKTFDDTKTKVVDTSKNVAETSKNVVDNTKKITDTKANIVETKKNVDRKRNVVDSKKNLSDITNNTKTIAQNNQKESSQVAINAKTATSKTVVQEQTEIKTQTNVSAKQTTTASKQTTTEAKQTTTAAKQTTTAAKQTTTAAKQTTTEVKQITTESKQTVTAEKQATTEGNKTTTEAKQTITQAKQALTQGKQSVTDSKQIKSKKPVGDVAKALTSSKTNEKDVKSTTSLQQSKVSTISKKDDNQIKSKITSGAVKKVDITESKTSTSSDVATVEKPKVTKKNGETTTEVVRRVPGGTEHTWTTVRADGTTKMESKTFFDTVEVEGSEEEEEEEYEEYEEVIEEETPPVKISTVKTSVGAVAAKGPKSPTVTEATPPNTPPLKHLIIGGASSNLKAEQEILETPPLDKPEQLHKKKLPSAPGSKVTQKVEKSAVDAPKPPPRKKEVKKPATGN